MRKHLASLFLFASMLGLVAPASAVVLQGSSYSFYLEGSDSHNPSLFLTNFDGIAQGGERAGLQLTVNEFETVVSGNSSLISITLSSNGDLFPSASDTAILAVGSEDALDLDPSLVVTLNDARVTLRNLAGGILYVSDNLVDLAAQAAPWDGIFPAPGGAFGVDELGGMGIAAITFDFLVSYPATETSVPEPGSLLLCGLGLMGLAAARRKRKFAH